MARTVTIEIGERSFKVAPYMLDELCEAAPFIDEMNAELPKLDALLKAKKQPPLTDLANYGRILSEIIAVGVSRVDPKMDAQAIRRMISPGSVASLQVAVMELLKSSGLTQQGEAKAPSPRKRKGAVKA